MDRGWVPLLAHRFRFVRPAPILQFTGTARRRRLSAPVILLQIPCDHLAYSLNPVGFLEASKPLVQIRDSEKMMRGKSI